MGFTPAQVDACSFWQLSACVDGFNRANNPGNPPPPSNAEFDDMLARRDQAMAARTFQ